MVFHKKPSKIKPLLIFHKETKKIMNAQKLVLILYICTNPPLLFEPWRVKTVPGAKYAKALAKE